MFPSAPTWTLCKSRCVQAARCGTDRTFPFLSSEIGTAGKKPKGKRIAIFMPSMMSCTEEIQARPHCCYSHCCCC